MTPAQEYRKLVNILENIVEAPEDDRGPGEGDTPGAAPAPTAPAAPASAGIPTIDAPNFKAAYAQAVKQKLKVFKWCGTYKVQAAAPSTGTNIGPGMGGKPPAAKPAAPERRQWNWPTGELGSGQGSDLPPSA